MNFILLFSSVLFVLGVIGQAPCPTECVGTKYCSSCLACSDRCSWCNTYTSIVTYGYCGNYHRGESTCSSPYVYFGNNDICPTKSPTPSPTPAPPTPQPTPYPTPQPTREPYEQILYGTNSYWGRRSAVISGDANYALIQSQIFNRRFASGASFFQFQVDLRDLLPADVPQGCSGEEFGTSYQPLDKISRDGSLAWIAAYCANVNGLSNAGAIHFFQHTTAWQYVGILTADQPLQNGEFGSASALSGDGLTLFVVSLDASYSAKVYIFIRSNLQSFSWQQLQVVTVASLYPNLSPGITRVYCDLNFDGSAGVVGLAQIYQAVYMTNGLGAFAISKLENEAVWSSTLLPTSTGSFPGGHSSISDDGLLIMSKAFQGVHFFKRPNVSSNTWSVTQHVSRSSAITSATMSKNGMIALLGYDSVYTNYDHVEVFSRIGDAPNEWILSTDFRPGGRKWIGTHVSLSLDGLLGFTSSIGNSIAFIFCTDGTSCSPSTRPPSPAPTPLSCDTACAQGTLLCADVVAGFDGADCLRFTANAGGVCKQEPSTCTTPFEYAYCGLPLVDRSSNPIPTSVLVSCGDLGCVRNDTCQLGAPLSYNDEMSEICFVAGERGECPGNQICSPSAHCVDEIVPTPAPVSCDDLCASTSVISCSAAVAGWENDQCMGYVSDLPGRCLSPPSTCVSSTDYSLCAGSARAPFGSCLNSFCSRPGTCLVGSLKSDNDEFHELCYVSSESGLCTGGQLCDANGNCVEPPTAAPSPAPTSTPMPTAATSSPTPVPVTPSPTTPAPTPSPTLDCESYCSLQPLYCQYAVQGWSGKQCIGFTSQTGSVCSNSLPSFTCSSPFDLSACIDANDRSPLTTVVLAECGDERCAKKSSSCQIDQFNTDNDALSKVCYVSNEPGDCTSGQICSTSASCIDPPTAAPTAVPTLAPTAAPTFSTSALCSIVPECSDCLVKADPESASGAEKCQWCVATPSDAGSCVSSLACPSAAAVNTCPTPSPTISPTSSPTGSPTIAPTAAPSLPPSLAPTTAAPTLPPTGAPTKSAIVLAIPQESTIDNDTVPIDLEQIADGNVWLKLIPTDDDAEEGTVGETGAAEEESAEEEEQEETEAPIMIPEIPVVNLNPDSEFKLLLTNRVISGVDGQKVQVAKVHSLDMLSLDDEQLESLTVTVDDYRLENPCLDVEPGIDRLPEENWYEIFVLLREKFDDAECQMALVKESEQASDEDSTGPSSSTQPGWIIPLLVSFLVLLCLMSIAGGAYLYRLSQREQEGGIELTAVSTLPSTVSREGSGRRRQGSLRSRSNSSSAARSRSGSRHRGDRSRSNSKMNTGIYGRSPGMTGIYSTGVEEASGYGRSPGMVGVYDTQAATEYDAPTTMSATVSAAPLDKVYNTAEVMSEIDEAKSTQLENDYDKIPRELK